MGIENIFRLKESDFLRALMVFLVIFCTGLTLILIFYNSYIYELDSIKIILLSVVFSIPNVFTSFALYLFDERKTSSPLNITLWFGLSFIFFYIHLFMFFISSALGLFAFNFYNYWLLYSVTVVMWILFSSIEEKGKK